MTNDINNDNDKDDIDDIVCNDSNDSGYVLVGKNCKITSRRMNPTMNTTVSTTDKNIIYFNNAAQAMISPTVQQAGIDSILNQMPNASTAQTSIRTLFGQLINSNSSQIALMPSTAFAITFAATNIYKQYKLKNNNNSINNNNDCTTKGRVILLQDQMDSQVYPWQDICKQSNNNVTLHIIPYPNTSTEKNETWTSLIVDVLNDTSNNTIPIMAACIPPLHWSDGTYIDIETIGKLCTSMNIPLIVDVTQAVGVIPFYDVSIIQPTIVCCSIHKWLRGPSGLSLVYISSNVQNDWDPLDQHGRSRECYVNDINYDAYQYQMSTTTGYPIQFVSDCRKFDSGGKPHPILLPMLQVSLQEIVQLNMITVQQQLQQLVQPLIDWVNSKPTVFQPLVIHNDDTTTTTTTTIANPRFYYHIIGIRPKNTTKITVHQLINICDILKTKYSIYISVRCGALRISSYVTNTSNDVQILIQALQECFQNFM